MLKEDSVLIVELSARNYVDMTVQVKLSGAYPDSSLGLKVFNTSAAIQARQSCFDIFWWVFKVAEDHKANARLVS